MRDTLIELILSEKKRGATILMSSHIFKELDDTADRVLFIDSGKQLDLVDRQLLSKEGQMIYRLGFKTSDDLDTFINDTSLSVLHMNEKYLHIDATVQNNGLEKLISEASRYDLRYMRARPFSLENYYSDILEKGGKESA